MLRFSPDCLWSGNHGCSAQGSQNISLYSWRERRQKLTCAKVNFTSVNISYQLDGPKRGRCEFFGTVASEKFVFIVFKLLCKLLIYCACELMINDDFHSGHTN